MKAKTIHIISSLTRGGRERQLSTIVSKAVLDGYPTKIVYFNSTKISYIEEYNLKHDILKIKSKIFFIRLLELDQLLRCHDPDVVYTWGNLESVFVLLLKPFHNFQFINGSVRHGIRLKKLSHYFRTAILHLSEHIVANSYAGLKANSLKKGYVLYNGVDPKFFECITPQKKKELKKKELGLVDNRPLFISIANLVPYKDYFSVLKALKLLREKSYSYFYLILGDGPSRNALEQLIKNYELNKNVQIYGHVENVKDFLNISDFLIHSSKGEGCSNAILEAMASGLFVVASNTGGTKEIVNIGNGYLFEYQEVNELFTILKNLLSNINHFKNLGEESKHIVSKKYSVERMMKNYYEIIDLILYSR